MALHLHDNGGQHNQHQLPFDGHIDWTHVMREISNVGYQGSTSLEPMNLDYEQLSIQQFFGFSTSKSKAIR